ncbi:N-(5'-phosphoribosyl)anthranilate isomerase [Legionella norrlandica]|uniref:N-(5'-phosphoribosyl)anthranilate isomerase n=2 Tax=Legionella norrlandica TaxID=1498499 RepID=A0A0A2SS01_9GAMM|nr:N-(5'-phosphoribosyl)anthranilate isomerase [Legionella norrlandica]
MTRPDDIEYAIHLGVDAIGLIFYPKSTRNVSLEKAKILVNNIPAFVDIVAVLVNPEQSFVRQIIDEIPVQLLQFHGEESPEFCKQFNKPFIKAIHPKTTMQIQQSVTEFIEARALLLDTPSNKAKGGTGLTFDWRVIPRDLPKPYVLAGGLNESNVLEAIKACHPYAVDVCSGVEALPGVKDHLKMSRFIKAIWG